MARAQNPDFASKVRSIFDRAPFVTDLGVRVEKIEEGACETTLDVAPRHAQQDGFVHAGVLATMADHTAGGAAGTMVAADEGVLTIEFKINFLRPAAGTAMRCRSVVLKAGRTISVVESEVFARKGSAEELVGKATVTLAVVKTSRLTRADGRGD